MSNLTTVAFLLLQCRECLCTAENQLTNAYHALEWCGEIAQADDMIRNIFISIMNYVEEQEDMDKQINKVKKDIKSDNKKKGVKDVNKLLKMDKKFDKKLEKCAKMSKKKVSNGKRS